MTLCCFALLHTSQDIEETSTLLINEKTNISYIESLSDQGENATTYNPFVKLKNKKKTN